jgi:hydroxyacylglutathione hydrolase
MDHLERVIGPLATNTHLLADPGSGEAIVIDAAIPGRSWIAETVVARGWRLVLVVSTHGHWDHAGGNAAVQAWTREQAAAMVAHAAEHAAAGGGSAVAGGAPVGVAVIDPLGGERRLAGVVGAEIAAHPADWYRMTDPQPLFAPFPIPACVPAVELAEGGLIRLGEVRLEVLHSPGHTEGSVCLYERGRGLLFGGDTLFPGGWGRVDLPGGDAAAMADSLARLARLPDGVRVLPGHGSRTTIGQERPWLDEVARTGRLPA